MAGGYDESKIAGKSRRALLHEGAGDFYQTLSVRLAVSSGAGFDSRSGSQHDLTANNIARIDVGTNANVPNALIYPMPKTALEGKFSIPFCMAIAVLERKAGIAQFTDRKVRDKKVVDLMKRVTLYVDDELEKLGYDQVRSRIRIKLEQRRGDRRSLRRRARTSGETDELGSSSPTSFATAPIWCCRGKVRKN